MKKKRLKTFFVVRPKCMYCEFATPKVTDPPCWNCYYTANRPNFKPNARCLELYEKIKGEKNE